MGLRPKLSAFPGGVVGREVLGEEQFKIGRTLFAGGAFFVSGAGFIIEMARAGDVRVLQRIGPSAKLT